MTRSQINQAAVEFDVMANSSNTQIQGPWMASCFINVSQISDALSDISYSAWESFRSQFGREDYDSFFELWSHGMREEDESSTYRTYETGITAITGGDVRWDIINVDGHTVRLYVGYSRPGTMLEQAFAAGWDVWEDSEYTEGTYQGADFAFRVSTESLVEAITPKLTLREAWNRGLCFGGTLDYVRYDYPDIYLFLKRYSAWDEVPPMLLDTEWSVNISPEVYRRYNLGGMFLNQVNERLRTRS